MAMQANRRVLRIPRARPETVGVCARVREADDRTRAAAVAAAALYRVAGLRSAQRLHISRTSWSERKSLFLYILRGNRLLASLVNLHLKYLCKIIYEINVSYTFL